MAARRPDDTGLLSTKGAPSDLQLFLGSINGLFERMRTMIDRRRRFVADGSHELHTPITALGLQADNMRLKWPRRREIVWML